MRRANKIILTMGSAMLISSGAALAGPPGGIAYNGFTASGGTITSACPSGATCGTPISGNGFLQRSVVISGTTYYQTIVLPTDANVASAADVAKLAFSDENFVQQGGGGGIADNQNLFAAGDVSINPGDFTATTAINSGWAQGTGSVISLSQTVNDTANAFNVGFTLTGNGSQASSIGLNQSVGLDGSDKQVFDLQQVTTSAAGNTSAFALPGANGGTIAWVSGDVIQAVWMGQEVTASGTQDSGFLGYGNVTLGKTPTAVSYTDQTVTGLNSGAFVGKWDTVDFGAAPTF